MKMKLRNEKRAIELASKLGFDDCLKVIARLPVGNPMFDVMFDRLEEIDSERFDKWLDNECGYTLPHLNNDKEVIKCH